jgi:ankyrin repeat protein
MNNNNAKKPAVKAANRALNALMVAAQHNRSAWAPNLRAAGNTARAARGEEALWSSLAPVGRGPDGRTALMYAAVKGDIPKVRWLLQRTPVILEQEDTEGHTALIFAAIDSRTAVAQVLLDAGADINHRDVYGDSALHFASIGELNLDDVTMIDLLLARGLDVNVRNKNGTTSLMMACIARSIPRVRRLLHAGADVNLRQTDDHYTVLHFACEMHTPGLIDILLGAGANINAQEHIGETPLHIACGVGIVENVRDLIRNHADLNAFTLERNTPLHFLANEPAEEHALEIAGLLLSAGCAVDGVNQNNDTPLHLASIHGHTDFVNLLLENRADPNLPNDNGSTALHLAIERSHIDIIRDLSRVTDKRVRNDLGLTPIALFTRRVAYLRGTARAFSEEVIGELNVLLEPNYYAGHIMGRNLVDENFHSEASGGRRKKTRKSRHRKSKKTRRH